MQTESNGKSLASSENFRDLGLAGDLRSPGPKNHPEDVRFYLALGVCVIVGIVVLGQMSDAIFRVPAVQLQPTLDAFGLYDAALFGIVGTVLGFYFASKE